MRVTILNRFKLATFFNIDGEILIFISGKSDSNLIWEIIMILQIIQSYTLCFTWLAEASYQVDATACLVG